MSGILKVFFMLSVFTMGSAYLFYRLYGSLWVFALVPILSFLPIFLFYVSRDKRNVILDGFIGHYFFYLNYILLVSISVSIIGLIFNFFSVDIFNKILERRELFQAGLLSFLVVIALYGSRNFRNISVENYRVLPVSQKNIRNMKLAFISDVHLNGNFDGSKLRASFEKMREEKVELVLIGGDFLDNSHRTVRDDIKKIIDENQFKHGIYLVLGNHEYYGGIDENIAYIKSLGIKILRDERVDIEGAVIVGRDDRHNKNRKPLTELLDGIDSEKTVVVVDHNPKSLSEIQNEKIDLYLSGHTHKGQIFPFNLIVDRMYLNPKGYKKIGETNTYVSSGLGTWLIPYRIGSRSEMLIFDIGSES